MVKVIYGVVNNNGGSIQEQIEFVFEDKNRAFKYSEEMNREYAKSNTYTVININMIVDKE